MTRPIKPTTPAETKRRTQATSGAKTGAKAQQTSTTPPPPAAIGADADVDLAADVELATWIGERRWFAQGGDDQPLRRRAAVDLGTAPPITVEIVGFGADRQYQLLRWTDGSTDEPDEPDVADDPVAAGALARFVTTSSAATAPDGATVDATWLPTAAPPGDAPARALGGEQSNTSVVIGGTHVLKLFRRVRPGIHPEVEVARHLASVGDGSLPVAHLAGWWQLTTPAEANTANAAASSSATDGSATDETTTALGVVQTFVPGALDGWSLVLSALAGDPGGVLPRLHRLGRALADLHAALALPAASVTQAAGDAADDLATFGSVPFPAELADTIANGTLDAARELELDGDLLQALQARIETAADAVRTAATDGDAGAAIRHHGDLHLGQVVWGDQGWVVLDFEGEPGRPLHERRARHSPLRDVAGMLRSLSYAVATLRRTGGNGLSDGWEPAARAAFLDGYLRQMPPTLLPTSPLTTRALVALLELEKAVYEVGYERSHRPDWVDIPLGHLREMTGEHR